MLRFSPSRLYTTIRSQRRTINNQSFEQLDNRRQLSRYKKRQHAAGGQNLSDRYLRLEKSLRGREALSKKLDTYSSIPAATQSNPISKVSPKPIQLFHGFEIPEKPKPPADDECCMSGCAICVYDLHEEALEAYKEALSSLWKSLTTLHIPEDEWPSSIRQQGSPESAGPDKRKEVVLNAFEEMEKALKLKRESEAETQARIQAKRNQLVPQKEKFSSGKAFTGLYEAFRWMFVNR